MRLVEELWLVILKNYCLHTGLAMFGLLRELEMNQTLYNYLRHALKITFYKDGAQVWIIHPRLYIINILNLIFTQNCIQILIYRIF